MIDLLDEKICEGLHINIYKREELGDLEIMLTKNSIEYMERTQDASPYCYVRYGSFKNFVVNTNRHTFMYDHLKCIRGPDMLPVIDANLGMIVFWIRSLGIDFNITDLN